MSTESTVQTSNKSTCPLEEWKYCRLADLTKALPFYGKERKFCPKCKFRATGKEGIYQLSHWANNYIDGYGQQSMVSSTITSSPSANLSHHVIDPLARVPTVQLEVTVTDHVMDPDEIEFLGMWCTRVVQAICPSVTVKQFH